MMPFLKLEKPIALPEGGYISTVGEALDFYFALPMHERIEEHWTETAKLLVSTFDENRGDVLKQAERQFPSRSRATCHDDGEAAATWPRRLILLQIVLGPRFRCAASGGLGEHLPSSGYLNFIATRSRSEEALLAGPHGWRE
jgi:hypothetical protein